MSVGRRYTARRGRALVVSGPVNARVDIDFDIGPAYYNFVDVRYIGEPLLQEQLYAPDQNVLYVSKTVNVTNITYSELDLFQSRARLRYAEPLLDSPDSA